MEYSIKVSKAKEDTIESNLKAMVSVTFGRQFKVNNISVIEANGRTYINMPSYETKQVNEDGKPVYKDICNPINSDFAKQLYADIITAYQKIGEAGISTVDMDFGNPEPVNISVSVYPLDSKEKDNKVAAMASMYIDNKFVVNNIRIINGSKGEFVSMPSYKTNQVDENNRAVFQDICYPVTAEFRKKMFGDILNTYKETVSKDMSKETAKNCSR